MVVVVLSKIFIQYKATITKLRTNHHFHHKKRWNEDFLAFLEADWPAEIRHLEVAFFALRQMNESSLLLVRKQTEILNKFLMNIDNFSCLLAAFIIRKPLVNPVSGEGDGLQGGGQGSRLETIRKRKAAQHQTYLFLGGEVTVQIFLEDPR